MDHGNSCIDLAALDELIESIEKFNANLDPELLTVAQAKQTLARCARGAKLFEFAVAALARRIDDADHVARTTGTSMGKAKDTVAAGRAMASSEDLALAMQVGKVSLDQASEISKAVESDPDAGKELVKVAQTEPFHVLKEKARKAKLEADQHKGLAERRRKARSARSYSDELGMTHIHLAVEPHIGTPILARAEAEARRIARGVTKGDREPFDRYLADAFASLLAGNGKGRARRPELVILVSYEVAKRGWKDVKKGEMCKIPGVGPIAPQTAKAIVQDAFLTGVLYDGVDLRQFKRWGRHIPVEVAIALELGEPPEFDGVLCVDCGNRFRTEFDHVEPRGRGGPTSNPNLKPRCWTCHQAKTKRDRAGPAP